MFVFGSFISVVRNGVMLAVYRLFLGYAFWGMRQNGCRNACRGGSRDAVGFPVKMMQEEPCSYIRKSKSFQECEEMSNNKIQSIRHGRILKSSRKACKINSFMSNEGVCCTTISFGQQA